MKQETIEEAAENYAEIYRCPATNKDEYCRHDIISAIKFGAKWQQERDREFYFKYIKSEKDFQIPRIAKLGINTTGQCFEQMVTSLIHLGERSYSEEEIKPLLSFILEIKDNWDCDEDSHKHNTICRCCDADKCLEQFKKK